MPPKEPSIKGDGLVLTEAELRTMKIAWQCFKTRPSVSLPSLFSAFSSHHANKRHSASQVDTARMAELGDWKNAASANSAFHRVKAKLLSDIKLPPAEKTPKKSACNIGGDDQDGDDEEEEQAKIDDPALKRKATPQKRKAAAAKTEDGDGDDAAVEEEETPQKKKKPDIKTEYDGMGGFYC